ncbi:YybH family protein [Pedobacter sp. GR22-10]|uniref:YybH family protein n=1 Tax=Pedobacter sp. GR22-10 TaxID=2994472 RepID=UPI00224608E6|nr:nuclear transport factor 2 family protein [Pedobacter sp. GR22-10]MCX2432868.1 nuclear transport factor 2 family protein [Pedobacter sp. GR22-10]
MKIKILTLLLICSVSAFAQAPKDKQAILDVLEMQRTEWNKGNLETFMQGYVKSDSLLFVGSSGPTYGWQKTLDNYKKTYAGKAGMGVLTFGIKKVDFLSTDVAFVLGSWHLKREKDEPQGYFTLLFKRLNGEWKIFVDHSS